MTKKGFTLVEAMVYLSLLSMLIYTYMYYAFFLTERNVQLKRDVERAYYDRGFAACISIIMMSLGMLSMILVSTYTVWSYAEQVDRRELRMQSRYNLELCFSWINSLIDEDRFVAGGVRIRHLGCMAHIDPLSSDIANVRAYLVEATSTLEYIQSADVRRVDRTI